MSDEPKVEAVQDNLSKHQWGRNFFWTQDGKKFSLNTKRCTLTLAALCSIVAGLNFVTGSEEVARPSGTGLSAPMAISAPPTIQIAPISPKDMESVGRKKTASVSIKYTAPQVVARPLDLKKIPPGSMVKAVLVSGASNGLVRAEMSESLSVDGERLIPEGSVLMGNGSSTDDRLLVSFSQVVFRDGSFGAINAQACDASDKIVGLKGSKIGNKAVNIAGAIGLGFVGGLSQGFQDTQAIQGAVIASPSMKNALLNGTTTAALQQSQNLMSDLQNQVPIIEVPPATPICVIFGVGQ